MRGISSRRSRTRRRRRRWPEFCVASNKFGCKCNIYINNNIDNVDKNIKINNDNNNNIDDNDKKLLE